MKNLIIRALTGIIFVVVLISAIYIHPIFFLILFCIITGLTLWEFGGLVKHYENANLQRTVNVLGGVYLFIATFVYANGLTDGKIFLPYLLFIMLTMIAELYYKAPNPINNWAFTLFAQVYCAGSFSILNFIGAEPGTPGVMSYTPLFIMAIFIFVWLDDTGAYFILFRKIGKSTSPAILDHWLRYTLLSKSMERRSSCQIVLKNKYGLGCLLV